MPEFSFQITGPRRTGKIITAHGEIATPAFMPVGTAATVKAMLPESVAATGAQIILGNTYHLMLRPGADRIQRLSGLHEFMNWHGPILTDSGGYQVMSLSKLRKITEKGVVFQSHLSGEKFELTPESSIEIQHKLGSTITMSFDECTPFPATWEEAKKSMELSMRWAERSRKEFDRLTVHSSQFVDHEPRTTNHEPRTRDGYALFGIVQGGIYPDLRKASIEALTSIGFDGYAIGGLAVGEGQELMFQTLDHIMPHMPPDKPRYLMGVGKPDDIIGAVQRGVDMFDCVLPTRSGRNGQAFTSHGVVNIRNAKYADDASPLDEQTISEASKYSRAYLHHLVKSGEILGSMLLTWHNLQFYQNLMKSLRQPEYN